MSSICTQHNTNSPLGFFFDYIFAVSTASLSVMFLDDFSLRFGCPAKAHDTFFAVEVITPEAIDRTLGDHFVGWISCHSGVVPNRTA